MPRNDGTQKYTIAGSFEISGKGTAVFFEGYPGHLSYALHTKLEVSIVRPDRSVAVFEAFVEGARKAPYGEVATLLFPAAGLLDLPVGTTVEFPDPVSS